MNWKRFIEKKWLQPLWLLLALEIIAVSINLFYAPYEIASGGATGLAILAEASFGWNVSLVVLGINCVMLVLAWFFLDRATTIRIALGSFLLPICLAITPQIKVVSDRTLAIVVGGAIFGVGVAILYRIDASSGGTTVPPLIFKKYFNLKPSVGLIMTDGLVCFLNVFVNGFEAFLLGFLSSMITLVVMNYIETGLDRKRVIYVMSNNHLDQIKTSLVTTLVRGVTALKVTGGYSGDDKEMLMLVVENNEYQNVLNHIHELAPDAFVLATNVVEDAGGFTEEVKF